MKLRKKSIKIENIACLAIDSSHYWAVNQVAKSDFFGDERDEEKNSEKLNYHKVFFITLNIKFNKKILINFKKITEQKLKNFKK